MKIGGKHFLSVWFEESELKLIDQTELPWELSILRLSNSTQVIEAIRSMQVRGAPAIGAAAAYGMHFVAKESLSAHDPHQSLKTLARNLSQARPTAVNLQWAVSRVLLALNREKDPAAWPAAALETACHIAAQDISTCRSIGEHGLKLFQSLLAKKNTREPLQILTHCNAGWIACVDWGTVTAPIYLAHEAGIPVHVWVSETRPRNQGALLTAWELREQGVPHTLIVDNAAGHVLQRGLVDIVLVGTDRVTCRGDVANKIGTYLKALAAREHRVPFYVAAPSSSIDWTITNGINDIPIEERAADEIVNMRGRALAGDLQILSCIPGDTTVANPSFDVTPHHLITGIITERGICRANEGEMRDLFEERDQKESPALSREQGSDHIV